MTCISVAVIAEECGANPGGLTPTLWVVRKKDVVSIPDATAGVISGDVVLVEGKVAVPWDFAIDTGEAKDETAGVVSSPVINGSVDFNIARRKAATNTVLDSTLGQACIVFWKERNGETKMIGDLEQGAYLGWKGTSGKKGADVNGKDCTFTREGMTHSPYTYTGTLPLE